MDFFYSTPKVCFGKDSIKYLSSLPDISRVFIVTDEQILKFGLVDKLIDVLKNNPNNCQIKVMSDIENEPIIPCFERGAELMLEYCPDTVIGIGGGTAINSAKGMWLLYEKPDIKLGELQETLVALKKKSIAAPRFANKAKLITIATTSGPVSEAASYIIVTNKEIQFTKYLMVDYDVTPDLVIVDPGLAAHVPGSVAASTGFDVLALAIETYVSIFASDFTDGLALKAIELVFNHLKRSCDNPQDEVARGKMHNASCIASLAFSNTYSGICHSLTNVLCGDYEIAHGVSNAILLPYIIEYNALGNGVPEFPTAGKYADITKHLGIGGNTIEEQVTNLVKAIRDLTFKLGMSASFTDCTTFSGDRIDKDTYLSNIYNLALRAYEDPGTSSNPKHPQVRHLEEILRKAFPIGNQ
jgi:acetaldehyde dehydrogenase / alcohol dehydrogenase